MNYNQIEIEYSKKWAAENPEIFTESILDFVEQHPGDRYGLTMTQTKGFFTLRATLIVT